MPSAAPCAAVERALCIEPSPLPDSRPLRDCARPRPSRGAGCVDVLLWPRDGVGTVYPGRYMAGGTCMPAPPPSSRNRSVAAAPVEGSALLCLAPEQAGVGQAIREGRWCSTSVRCSLPLSPRNCAAQAQRMCSHSHIHSGPGLACVAEEEPSVRGVQRPTGSDAVSAASEAYTARTGASESTHCLAAGTYLGREPLVQRRQRNQCG